MLSTWNNSFSPFIIHTVGARPWGFTHVNYWHVNWINNQASFWNKSCLFNKLITSSDSESKMCSQPLPLRLLRMWLCCEKYSFHDYCSSREMFCVILDYKTVASPLIAALLLQARNLIVLIFFECRLSPKKSRSEEDQSVWFTSGLGDSSVSFKISVSHNRLLLQAFLRRWRLSGCGRADVLVMHGEQIYAKRQVSYICMSNWWWGEFGTTISVKGKRERGVQSTLEVASLTSSFVGRKSLGDVFNWLSHKSTQVSMAKASFGKNMKSYCML